MNNLKESIYSQIDYSSKASIYASKLKLENALSSSAVLDDEIKEYYRDAIDEINNIIIFDIKVENKTMSIKIPNVLTEAPVIGGTDAIYYISCDPSEDKDFSKDTAYFKVYDKNSYSSSTKVARLCITNPKYVNHKNRDGKKHWKLNSIEKKLLNEILRKKYRGETIWNWICWEFNKEYSNNFGTTFDFGNTIPDYSNIAPPDNMRGWPK